MNTINLSPALSANTHADNLGYSLQDVRIGIVHIGPGAFHRGHQAAYVHEALKIDPNWGICGVQMRSQGVRDSLAPQDNLYTLAKLDHEVDYSVIGSLVELLSAKTQLDKVLDRMASPSTHIFSTTVTEKGYCLTPEGNIDVTHPDIIHDFDHTDQPSSVVGLITEALKLRRAAGYCDVTVVCCDNMSENGERLRAAVCQFASLNCESLAAWISDKVAFPSTMVDSITPATTDALRERVIEEAGWSDSWPISRESFTQWVIEDKFSGPKPPWSEVGVNFTDRVDFFEKAKLRLLNGTHSSLAYVGLLAGYETVGEAMKHPSLSSYLSSMMQDEIVPTLADFDGLDYPAYSAEILDRYRNPEIVYQLAQIAWDGSQKVPFRLLHTIEDGLGEGQINRRLIFAVAAWMQFVRRCGLGQWDMTDGMKEALMALAEKCNGDAEHDVALFLSMDKVFSVKLSTDTQSKSALVKYYGQLEIHSGSDVLPLLDQFV